MMVSGEVDVILDDKFRLTLPMQFRKEINPEDIKDFKVKITRGFHKFLLLMTFEKWEEEFGNKIKENTGYYNKTDDFIIQKYIVPTQEVEIDKNGRILIPPRLRRYAGITKDCVVVGRGETLGIWDAETYDKFSDENDPDNAARFESASEEFSRRLGQNRGIE